MTTNSYPRLTALGLAVASLRITHPASLRAETLFGLQNSGTDGNLFTIDPDTGIVTPIGEIPFVEALTFGAGGELYASAGNDLIRIDPETADVTTIGSFGTSPDGVALPMPGLVFDRSTGMLLGPTAVSRTTPTRSIPAPVKPR